MKKAITKSTNWLTAGLSEEELLAKKTLAIIAADIQLKRIELGLDQKEFAKLLYNSSIELVLLGDEYQNINGGGEWFTTLEADKYKKVTFRCSENICKWIR